MPKKKKSASNIAAKNERAGRHNLKKYLEQLAKRDAQDVADVLEAEQGWMTANQYFARSKRARSPSPPVFMGSSPPGSPTGSLAMARVAKQPRMQSPFAIPQSMAIPRIRSQLAIPQTIALPPLPRFSDFAPMNPFATQSALSSVLQDTARGELRTQRMTTTGQVIDRSSRNPTGDARPQDAEQSPGYRGGFTMVPQPLGAPYDYWQERDHVLQVELGRKFSECSNDMIVRIYGQCSIQHHQLLVLLAGRERAEMAIDAWQQLPAKKHGCRSHRVHAPTIQMDCPDCDQRIQYHTAAHRLVAIFNEPDCNLWMGVVTMRGSSTKIFQASARCNIYQGDIHCVRFDHIFLETIIQNKWRAGNHSGTYGCFCPLPCIGDHVLRGALTFEELEGLKTATYVYANYPRRVQVA